MNIETLFQCSLRPGSLGRPYVIAEAGVNHEGSMALAKRLVDEAKWGGADAIKFQTYRAETLAIKDSPAYWDTSRESTLTQFELFARHARFWKAEMEELKSYCDDVGIDFLSTPFDFESVDFLAALVPAFKVASADLTNQPLIERCCVHGKPIILSTGASTLWEIQRTVDVIRSFDVPLALLHCVLNYPTVDRDAALGRIIGLKSSFPGVTVGYSDHTLPGNGLLACEIAVMLGARVVEKHFTHDKSLPGNDHYHAMDKHDLRAFVARCETLASMVGGTQVAVGESELLARRHARRSVVAARRISKGEVISIADLEFKRPGHGISPMDYRDLLGRTACVDIPSDEVLSWAMFE